MASGEERQGILTDSDKQWLGVETSKADSFSESDLDRENYDQKRRCKKGLAAALQDLQGIVEDDFEDHPTLENVGELFNDVEDEVGLSPEECGRNLIALAYIITNGAIEYPAIVENMALHPRESGRPSSSDRPEKGGPVDFDQPTDDILAFREALSQGIKQGKRHLGEETPGTVLIDSNTELYREPTMGDIDPNDESVGFSMADVRDAFATHLDGEQVPGYGPEKDAGSFTRQDGLNHLKTELKLNIEQRLNLRRGMSDQEIKRHDLNRTSD